MVLAAGGGGGLLLFVLKICTISSMLTAAVSVAIYAIFLVHNFLSAMNATMTYWGEEEIWEVR